MLAIFSWVAEQERENLSERTKAGVARARNEGKHIGRPFREINWRKVDEYCARGVIVVGRFEDDGHPLQHAASGKGTKNGKRELKV
jgi:DNA invertase Pin-like site-specific DNA recombinase